MEIMWFSGLQGAKLLCFSYQVQLHWFHNHLLCEPRDCFQLLRVASNLNTQFLRVRVNAFSNWTHLWVVLFQIHELMEVQYVYKLLKTLLYGAYHCLTVSSSLYFFFLATASDISSAQRLSTASCLLVFFPLPQCFWHCIIRAHQCSSDYGIFGFLGLHLPFWESWLTDSLQATKCGFHGQKGLSLNL